MIVVSIALFGEHRAHNSNASHLLFWPFDGLKERKEVARNLRNDNSHKDCYYNQQLNQLQWHMDYYHL